MARTMVWRNETGLRGTSLGGLPPLASHRSKVAPTHPCLDQGSQPDPIRRVRLASLPYGQIRAAQERLGTPIGVNDLPIAAHARSEGLTLVSNNRREFERVAGLLLENWA